MTTYVRLADIRVGDKVRVSREAIVEEAGPTGVKLSTGDWYGKAFLDGRDYDVEIIERGPEPTVREHILALPVGSIFTLTSNATRPNPRMFVKVGEALVEEIEGPRYDLAKSTYLFGSWTLAEYKLLYTGKDLLYTGKDAS